MQDLEDLLEDIKVYIELEQGKNADFWKDMTIVTEEELTKLRKLDPESKGVFCNSVTMSSHQRGTGHVVTNLAKLLHYLPFCSCRNSTDSNILCLNHKFSL